MLTGGCLCASIRFTISGEHTKIDMCHCSLCRKVSGSGHCAAVLTYEENLKWLAGEELIQIYKHTETFTPAFCKKCGSPVPLIGHNGYCFVPAGSLDNDPTIGVWKHLFVASKATWDAIGDDAPQYTERPE